MALRHVEPYYWFVLPILAVASFYILRLGNPIYIGLSFIVGGASILFLSFQTSPIPKKPNTAYAILAATAFALGMLAAAIV